MLQYDAFPQTLWHSECNHHLLNATHVKAMNGAPEGCVLEVGKANFDSEVLRSHRPVLVVFWARWSSACRVATPALNEVMREISGRVKLVKINADENPNLSLWYGIQSLPTLLYFLNGVVLARIVGAASKEAILAQLESSTQNNGTAPISGPSTEHG
jgi:thioredoxin 1